MTESAQTALLRRISDGVIGWTVSERAGGNSPYAENSICDRISQIARGKRWDVEREYLFDREKLDFVFFGKPRDGAYTRAAILEVKFISPRTGRPARIGPDLAKLSRFDQSNLLESKSLRKRKVSKSISLRRYFMLLGRIHHMPASLAKLDQSKKTSRNARKLWEKVFDEDGFPNGAQQASDLETSAGWVRFSPAFLKVDESMLILRDAANWIEFVNTPKR